MGKTTPEDTERGLVARYVGRVIEHGHLPTRTLRHVMYWLNERAQLLNLPVPEKLSKTVGNIYSGGFDVAAFERNLAAHRGAVLKMLQAASAETEPPQPLSRNIEQLTDALELPSEAIGLVELLTAYTRYEYVQYFCDCLTEASGSMSRMIAILADAPLRTVEDLLSPLGDLVASGLVQRHEGDEISGSSGRYRVPHRIDTCLDRDFETFEDMRQALLGAPLTAGITPSDYDHVESDRELISAVLQGTSDTHATGVSVLLYGEPGTGKTELTKVVAQASNVTIYGAGESDGGSGEGKRTDRLADLVFSLKLLAGSERTALLFDEMEDVAWQLLRRGGSKVYLNRLLETNPVPIFWTSNNIHEIDPALLRRMTVAVELKMPPARQRERILARLAKRHDVALTDDEIERLSQKVTAAPAVLENALRAASLAGGGAEAFERAAQGIVRAVSGARAQTWRAPASFDPRLIRSSRDIDTLTQQLEKRGDSAFSLCLSGAPGTGKSAYARHLAGLLGLEVVQKRASDLLGMYVGESEKRIAEAFEEAREAGAFLIFDEADSFLLDRKDAVRSWEITQVNEMLTWMEEHPFPVCFTTNLMDRLDAASLRRFTFHIRFDPLDAQTLRLAYDLFFGMKELPPEALRFDFLTPGDFAQARKQADVLGILDRPDDIVALLSDIARGKPGATGRIGFQ